MLFSAMAVTAKPIIARNPAEWAEQDRYVAAESGSSRPGKWRNKNQPLAIEPMEKLGADHPCSDVVLKFSAQFAKTEVGINWCGQTICDDPCSMLIVVPSLEEQKLLNNTKFQPTVDATPTLRAKVQDVVERSRSGSTSAFKRFKGGFLQMTTAMSSKGLQGRSIKRLWGDEVSEFPMDAGGRGDPVKQARARGDAHDDFKCLWTSTPKELPNCRITDMYEAGDQSQYYAECPTCHMMQVLLFENMVAPEKKGGRATFRCIVNDCSIDEIHKQFMLGEGRFWIRCYPSLDPANPAPPPCFPKSQLDHWRGRPSEGRYPSYWAWQAYSMLKSWTKIHAEYVTAVDDVTSGRDPDAMKVFHQQKLGLAWDAASDAPNSQKLFEVRGKFVKRGIIPGWACEIAMVADNQGDRIEWDVFAIGPDLAMARFDWGVIEHDPLTHEAWAELAAVIARRWPGEKTVDLGIDIVGIDLGGKKGVTERVYRFVRARPNVYAIKGSSDYEAIPITKGKRRRIRLEDGSYISVEPWLIGGWGLKKVIYSMLETTLDATDDRLAGGLYNPIDATLEDFKQYTSEVFKQPKTMRAGAHGWWERIPGQANERLDLGVYARAMFYKRGSFTRTPAEWQSFIASRLKAPESDMPLFDAADMPKAMPEAITAENPNHRPGGLFSRRKSL